MTITASNLSAFMKAALARARELKADSNEEKQAVGELLAHTAGVISMQAGQNPVDPHSLSAIFRVGGADREYADYIAQATQEIRDICAKLAP